MPGMYRDGWAHARLFKAEWRGVGRGGGDRPVAVEGARWGCQPAPAHGRVVRVAVVSPPALWVRWPHPAAAATAIAWEGASPLGGRRAGGTRSDGFVSHGCQQLPPYPTQGRKEPCLSALPAHQAHVRVQRLDCCNGRLGPTHASAVHVVERAAAHHRREEGARRTPVHQYAPARYLARWERSGEGGWPTCGVARGAMQAASAHAPLGFRFRRASLRGVEPPH